MRAFIVLCLVAVACADKLGYNYQPVGHSGAGLSFAPGGSSVGGGADGGFGAVDAGFGAVDAGFAGGAGGVGDGAGGFGGGVGDGAGGQSGAVGGQNVGGGGAGGFDGGVGSYGGPSTSELEKEYYTFSAPEGDFDDGDTNQQVSNSLKQGLRVIFIKGPENRGLENAALSLAKQAGDQKTDIYVLNKQADIGDLANRLNSVRNDHNNQPEVHFVKYRTPEDAANAQHQIQSQYDGLGGTSKSHNGGVAPVLNFASQAPVQRAPSAQAPGSSYLPASIFRLRF